MDPYQLLGVSSTATDEEIKKAYRAKCKLYHPDLNPDDPTAEEKFKQVQAAYDRIMKIRSGNEPYSAASSGSYSTSQGGYSYGQQQYSDPFGFGSGGFRFYGPFGFGYDFGSQGFGGYQQAPHQDEPIEMQAARNYINARRYREALNVLASIKDRNARWFYYHALANLGLGNSITALESARTACNMEPGNREYANLLARLQGQGQQYRNMGTQYGMSGYNPGRFCMSYFLMSLLCSCFGLRMPFFFCC